MLSLEWIALTEEGFALRAFNTSTSTSRACVPLEVNINDDGEFSINTGGWMGQKAFEGSISDERLICTWLRKHTVQSLRATQGIQWRRWNWIGDGQVGRTWRQQSCTKGLEVKYLKAAIAYVHYGRLPWWRHSLTDPPLFLGIRSWFQLEDKYLSSCNPPIIRQGYNIENQYGVHRPW